MILISTLFACTTHEPPQQITCVPASDSQIIAEDWHSTTEPDLATSYELYMKWLADNHPTWKLPSWTHGGALSWTMTGALDASDEALVSNDGAVAPWARAPIAQVWIRDAQTGDLLPIQWRFGLVNDYFPLPQWWSDEFGLSLYGSLIHDAETNSIQWQIKAYNGSDVDYQLLISVLPFAVNRASAPIYAVSANNNQQIWVNNAPFMATNTAPDAIGVGRVVDVMDGNIPAQIELGCIPQGDGAVIMRYGLYRAGYQEIQVAFPPAPDADNFPTTDKPFWKIHSDASVLWREQINRVGLHLPDARVTNAARASIGYLHIATDPDGVHLDPFTHHAVSVRDMTYIGLALLQAGHSNLVKNFIPHIFDEQTSDGKITPTQGDAWDWQGQAIFLVTTYYRYTQDIEMLRQYYPQMRLAGEFIRTLRANYAPQNPAVRGLLPPSQSADNLGQANQHHYRDNLWAIIGLRELVFASDLLGENDGEWALAEADSINRAILDSIELLLGENPPYLPVSVEELGTPAMAQGSVPMVYPSDAFQVADDFIERSFQYYFDQWVAPYNGGFVHRDGQFWIYGGLELAHAFLRLGMEAPFHAVLGWTLSNQTMDGMYAWAEQVSPVGLGFAGGDMPHAGVMASFYILARTLIVWERDDAIELFRLAPSWWFENGREVVANGLPTMYGDMTLRTTTDLTMTETGWRGVLRLSYELLGDMPEGGILWRLPYAPSDIRTVNGARFEDGMLRLSASDDVIVMTFGD